MWTVPSKFVTQPITKYNYECAITVIRGGSSYFYTNSKELKNATENTLDVQTIKVLFENLLVLCNIIILKSLSNDTNNDGINDLHKFEISFMGAANEKVQAISIILFFDVQITVNK